jgi:tetratricopeptide (TPR) repeat protein
VIIIVVQSALGHVVAAVDRLTAVVERLAAALPVSLASTRRAVSGDAESIYWDLESSADEGAEEHAPAAVAHIPESDVARACRVADEYDTNNRAADGAGELEAALPKASLPQEQAEVLWRLGRAYYSRGDAFGKSSVERERELRRGLDYAERALTLSDVIADVHKWCVATNRRVIAVCPHAPVPNVRPRVAILKTEHAAFGGAAKQIETAYFFREHVERAIQLNPNDAILYHLLGRYCFEISQMGWVVRRAASALFGEPPTATVEEALAFFERAERLKPRSWASNTAWYGRVLALVGRKVEARQMLEAALSIPSRNAEDEKALDDARKALSSL